MKIDKLVNLRACSDALEYVKTQKTIAGAWQNCERGDWMLWLAKELKVDDKKLTMAKAMCAKQVEYLMTDQRSKDALQACFDYVNGKITREQLDAYAYAAYDAYAYAAYAYTYAAYAAYAAAAYAYAYYAADVAAYAAAADAAAYDAAADAYADAAYAYAAYAARETSLRKSADICREYLTEEVLAKYKRLR
jgi:hypothetical protein